MDMYPSQLMSGAGTLGQGAIGNVPIAKPCTFGALAHNAPITGHGTHETHPLPHRP